MFKYFVYLLIIIFFSFFQSTKINAENLFQRVNLKIEKKIMLFNKSKKRINFYRTLTDNRKYIINFWATWCVPCKKELPELQKMQNENMHLDIKIISIDKKDIKKQVIFLKKHNVTNLKMYFDPNMNLFKSLKLRGIPTTLIVKKRKAIGKKEGKFDYTNNSIREINGFFN